MLCKHFCQLWIILRLNILVREIKRYGVCVWCGCCASEMCIIIATINLIPRESQGVSKNEMELVRLTTWQSSLNDIYSLSLFLCHWHCVNVASTFDVRLKYHEFSTVWYKFAVVRGCLMLLKVLVPNQTLMLL